MARPRSQAAVLEIHDIRKEVEALGLPYRYERLSLRQRLAAKTEEAGAGFADTSPLLDIACRHFAGDAPFCMEERLINLEAVPEAEIESFADTAPGPWLISHVPWSAAEHTIRAIAADRATARLLGIGTNAACLVVERRTWSGGLPVTRVRLTYPGTSHAVVARFTPEG